METVVNKTLREFMSEYDARGERLLNSIRLSKCVGSQLDQYAYNCSIQRIPGKWYWPFGESDGKLRSRLIDFYKGKW